MTHKKDTPRRAFSILDLAAQARRARLERQRRHRRGRTTREAREQLEAQRQLPLDLAEAGR